MCLRGTPGARALPLAPPPTLRQTLPFGLGCRCHIDNAAKTGLPFSGSRSFRGGAQHTSPGARHSRTQSTRGQVRVYPLLPLDSVKPRPEAARARTGAHGNALILRHLGAWLLVTEPLVLLLGLGVCGSVLALVLGAVLGTL